jgi:hypothetical protein
MRLKLTALAALMVIALAGCGGGDGGDATTGDATPTTLGQDDPRIKEPAPSPTAPAPAVPTTVAPTTTTTISPFARPAWLGTRPLPLRPDEHGEVQPTPPVLVDRRLATPEDLPPPAGGTFEWSIETVPAEVLARSSWVPECPVTAAELAYVTVSHMGFDGEYHTGELLVNAAWAGEVVEVFEELHAARFPIEQMRIIRAEEIDAPPTGDWNDTTSFVCRPAVGNTSWSQHAYGLAVDVNPFHNPYLKGDLVLPELASSYTDRDDKRPGMIEAGDIVVTSFADMGWAWGGNWNTLKDWMHFSASGG